MANEEEIEDVPAPLELLKNQEIIKDVTLKKEGEPKVSSSSNIKLIKNISRDKAVTNISSILKTVSPIDKSKQISNCVSTTKTDSIGSFLSNRKVIAKDQSLPDTSIVVIRNLAAGTTEVKLRKMCETMGEVQVRLRV